MSKYQKLIRRILDNQTHVTFEELHKILIREGCECREPKGGSSHRTYFRDDLEGIRTVPYKRPHIGATYVRQVIEWLGLEEKYGED